MSVERQIRDGKAVYVDTDVGDAFTNPMYAVQIEEDGSQSNWMAFDPRYGPESKLQIEWHVKNGTPGAETWEVGKPC